MNTHTRASGEVFVFMSVLSKMYTYKFAKYANISVFQSVQATEM